MVKVIFIASLSHSGSTLLDLMLNAHPEVASVGELKQLGRFARLEKPNRQLRCTCGAESLLSCKFWTRVGDLTNAATGRTIGELNVEDYDEAESFDGTTPLLFEAIATVAGTRYVVDSSKQVARLRAVDQQSRARCLPDLSHSRSQGTDLLVQESLDGPRQADRQLRPHQPRNLRAGEGIGRIRWCATRSSCAIPSRCWKSLMQQIGLSFEPEQLEWASRIRHNVGGNGMRRSSSSELKLDERWRDHFTLLQKLAIDAGTLPGRYRFARSVPSGTTAGTP